MVADLQEIRTKTLEEIHKNTVDGFVEYESYCIIHHSTRNSEESVPKKTIDEGVKHP